MMPYKLPLTSGNITRFFVLFILLLLLTSGFMIQNSIGGWLMARHYAMDDIASAMQKRIESYRFATWQIYENLAASATGSEPSGSLQETRLRPDVYALDKTRRKTEALIFGAHDSSTLDMSLRMSNYLDTLWGAENSPWSMYFLNGQDNSLILVSTLPLKDMATRYKDSAIGNVVEARRAEMLQQANALDERESFSPLRRLTWQNDRYFTLRTTFNQPGHLATVVAFDLPLNDIIPATLSPDNFQLKPNIASMNEGDSGTNDVQNVRVSWINSDIEISTALAGTPLQLIYTVSITQLAVDTLHSLLWPLLINFSLLLLSLAGLFYLRQPSLRPSENQSAELESLRLLNEEIVAAVPVGLLVYDFGNNRSLLSNKIAEHLLPHLNLQKIIKLSDQHQGVLQATVNNEVYEIRHMRSGLSPHTQLFMMRDQDRELLVNRKLQKAQRVLDQNHQARQQLLQNLGGALQHPLQDVIQRLKSMEHEFDSAALSFSIESAQSLGRLIDDIVLLNQLETMGWTADISVFNLQSLLDELATDVLPVMRDKGLTLTIANHLNSDELRVGDRRALHKIISALVYYAITTTTWGRIGITVNTCDESGDRLAIDITDTGAGLSKNEMANIEFPFLGETHVDRFRQASGMAFFLCTKLCEQLGGQLEVHTSPEIGTHYRIELPAALQPQEEQEEKLLEDVTALVDVTVDDVRKIVVHQLENWGAVCITPDERLSSQEYDVLLTDDPSRLTSWSLLLTADEPGFSPLAPNQYKVNFNISSAMQDAVLQLIERRLDQGEPAQDSTALQDTSQLFASGYFQLFMDTVPDDIRRLYNEAADREYDALAQTAHRLKGVFAMLNMIPGKQLCETLELQIRELDDVNIKNTTSEIDAYVNDLLQQGKP